VGEEIAALFLRLKGFEVLEANRALRAREVDLVARDGTSRSPSK
jgi:Holliday junction resolvase-like predicted endonuclease